VTNSDINIFLLNITDNVSLFPKSVQFIEGFYEWEVAFLYPCFGGPFLQDSRITSIFDHCNWQNLQLLYLSHMYVYVMDYVNIFKLCPKIHLIKSAFNG